MYRYMCIYVYILKNYHGHIQGKNTRVAYAKVTQMTFDGQCKVLYFLYFYNTIVGTPAGLGGRKLGKGFWTFLDRVDRPAYYPEVGRELRRYVYPFSLLSGEPRNY